MTSTPNDIPNHRADQSVEKIHDLTCHPLQPLPTLEDGPNHALGYLRYERREH